MSMPRVLAAGNLQLNRLKDAYQPNLLQGLDLLVCKIGLQFFEISVDMWQGQGK